MNLRLSLLSSSLIKSILVACAYPAHNTQHTAHTTHSSLLPCKKHFAEYVRCICAIHLHFARFAITTEIPYVGWQTDFDDVTLHNIHPCHGILPISIIRTKPNYDYMHVLYLYMI